MLSCISQNLWAAYQLQVKLWRKCAILRWMFSKWKFGRCHRKLLWFSHIYSSTVAYLLAHTFRCWYSAFWARFLTTQNGRVKELLLYVSYKSIKWPLIQSAKEFYFFQLLPHTGTRYFILSSNHLQKLSRPLRPAQNHGKMLQTWARSGFDCMTWSYLRAWISQPKYKWEVLAFFG